MTADDATGGPEPVRKRTRIDGHLDRYAERARGMRASEIRALFAVASRPEVISFAGGMPDLATLPLDDLAPTFAELVLERGTTALQYASAQGDPGLREQITEVMAEQGIPARVDEIVVTVGSQQGLDLLTRIFCDPGDVVLCEAPSYVGALGVFSSYQCDVVHLETDAEGLVPAALAGALERLAATGRSAKLLYTIPNFHNPAGVTLSAGRRAEILEICARADLLVVEDDPYGLLGFETEPGPALHSLGPDRVLYLGTFSKTFAPGLRVGWIVAPAPVRDRLVLAQEAAILCPPTFSQLAVSRYLAGHDWRGQVKAFRGHYHERRDAMLRALTDRLRGQAHWTRPGGGFYVWLRLPPGVDSGAMLPRALREQVAYVPGRAFFADGSGTDALRLSYCHPSPDRIHEGVRRLAEVIRAESALADAFGRFRAPSHPGGWQRPAPDLG